MNIVKYVPSFLRGDGPSAPRMAITIDRHERHHYAGGKIVTELSPPKQERLLRLMRAAGKKRDDAIEAAGRTFADAKSVAKSAFDKAIAEADPIHRKAVADAEAEFERVEQELLGANTQPLPGPELEAMLTANTPVNHVVRLPEPLATAPVAAGV